MNLNPSTLDRDVLQQAPCGGHLVQFYEESEELLEQLLRFVEPALRGSEAVILVASPERLRALRDALLERGVEINGLIAAEQCTLLDCAETLQRLMYDGVPNWDLFQSVLGQIIKRLSRRHGKVRVFGEMVNLLCQSGQFDAAVQLEDLWNSLSMFYPFSLFCAYELDLFDLNLYPKRLAELCDRHSHAFTMKLDRSNPQILERAISEVLEPPMLSALRMVVSKDAHYASHLSPSLHTLLWLNQHMPLIARQILVRARYYHKHPSNTPRPVASLR